MHTPPGDAEEVRASCLIVDQSDRSPAEATIGFGTSGRETRLSPSGGVEKSLGCFFGDRLVSE